MKTIAFCLPGLMTLLCGLSTDCLGQHNTNHTPAHTPSVQDSLTGGTRRVGVDEFDSLRRQTNAVVLDVRTAKEFAAGHIAGATNLDFNQPGFAQQVAALDKGRAYLVHCAAGRRSAKASELMRQQGFTNVVDLAPGFRAWEKAGKPVEK